MANLIILTPTEQHIFDNPPKLSLEEKAIYFFLSDNLQKEVNRLRTASHRVLQIRALMISNDWDLA